MSRSTKNKFLVGIAALAIVAGGFALVEFTSMGGAAAQQSGEAPAMPVPYVTVKEAPVQIWKEFSGKLTAVDSAQIRPQVSGLIQEVHFSDGQIVKKGDLLYTIDQRPYEAAVAQAKAEASSAWNDVQFAKKEMARAEELLKTGAISKQGYDTRVNSLKVNQGAVSAAQARVKAAEVDLDHATIEAPIDGRVGRPEITAGNLVNAQSAPLLTTIVSDTNIYADFEVDEQTYLSFVRKKAGQDVASEQKIPVRLLLNNDEKVYQGEIKSFDNQISSTSGTIRARAVFNNEDIALLPGMFAKVQIGSTGTENRITITEKAIQTDQSRKFVYVVGEDHTATYREVKPGDTIAGERIITAGLQPGDKVIVDGLMKLRPGAKVQPMTPEEMEAMKKQMAAQAAGGQQAPAAEALKEEIPKEEEKKPEAAPPAADAPAAEEPAAEPAPQASEQPATAQE